MQLREIAIRASDTYSFGEVVPVVEDLNGAFQAKLKVSEELRLVLSAQFNDAADLVAEMEAVAGIGLGHCLEDV